MPGKQTIRGGLGALATAALSSAATAPAETPPRLWSGVARVGVACLVNTDRGVDGGALHDRLCAHVRALAADGAPVPVAVVRIGDVAIAAPDHLTLLVHASTSGTPAGRLMAVTIRPYRNAAGANQLFGAEPRVVATAAPDDALDAALSAPLAQILPWRAAPRERPIR